MLVDGPAALVDGPVAGCDGVEVPFPDIFSYTLKMLRRDCEPTASLTADESLESTLKASAMHDVATSMFSTSSADSVPSFVDLVRKSMILRASRFLVSDRPDMTIGFGAVEYRGSTG